MAKFVSIFPSLHFRVPNVRWPSMRLSIVLLLIFQTTIARSSTIRHRRQNIFESEASIDKTSLSVSNETSAAIGTENEPPAVMYENDDGAGGGSMDDVIEEELVQLPLRTKSADGNEVNNNHSPNEVVKVSSTTDINNVIEQSFGARNNDTNARAVTVATLATTSSTSTSSSSSSSSRSSTAPSNFTKDFSHDESVENR